MGLRWYRQVWVDPRLKNKPSGSKLVMLALADFADEETGECWPSIVTISTMTGVTERQVQRILRNLEDEKFIETDIHPGRSKSNVYRILEAKKVTPMSPNTSIKGDISSIKGDISSIKGDAHVTRSIIDPSIDPSLGEDARADDDTPTTQPPPPPLPVPSVPWQHKPQRREKVVIDGMQAKLEKFGIAKPQFTAMVDSHLSAKGTKELADGDGEAADRELRTAQQFVLDLCGIGKRFWVPNGVVMVWDSWKANDKRSNPSEQQLLQHASQMVNGKIMPAKPAIHPNGIAKPAGVYVGTVENLK